MLQELWDVVVYTDTSSALVYPNDVLAFTHLKCLTRAALHVFMILGQIRVSRSMC